MVPSHAAENTRTLTRGHAVLLGTTTCTHTTVHTRAQGSSTPDSRGGDPHVRTDQHTRALCAPRGGLSAEGRSLTRPCACSCVGFLTRCVLRDGSRVVGVGGKNVCRVLVGVGLLLGLICAGMCTPLPHEHCRALAGDCWCPWRCPLHVFRTLRCLRQ